MSVVCCQVEVSATGRVLVQRSLTECGVSVCDLGTSRIGCLVPLGLFSHEKIYEGWNFNSGNYLFTTDTK